MAMYYYASKISAIACGTRCKQSVLQKSRGQRDRDKCSGRHHHHHQRHHRHCQRRRCHHSSSSDSSDSSSCSSDDNCCGDILASSRCDEVAVNASGNVDGDDGGGIFSVDAGGHLTATDMMSTMNDGLRFRRHHSTEQLSAYDLEMSLKQIQLAHAKLIHAEADVVQYDIPKNTHRRSQCDINFESSVLGSGGIMYINGKIVSGPLESLIEVLIPKNIIDFDKEFIFSFLLSSRLFLRPHEMLGKLLNSIPDSECMEPLVELLAEWTNKFPYDYRDERMMNHVKHIVARCSNSHLEAVVSQTLSALLKRLTDLERHEANLRACQSNNDKMPATLSSPTATQYAQIVCRLEKKLAKHVGPEEFVQCSSMILLDKQKKWDQPSTSGGPPGAQDPKKTCNLETYLDWSARLRLFVCNEILQCSGIRDRSRTVELWSGVAQYCLLVGNYNSATAILESLESPPIARLKITWSKLQVTCQQLDCMQRHAEGHGHLWQKQAIVLNEQHHHHHQQQHQHHQHHPQNQQQQRLQQEQENENKQQQQQLHEEEHQPNLKTDTAVVLLSTTAKSSTTASPSPPQSVPPLIQQPVPPDPQSLTPAMAMVTATTTATATQSSTSTVASIVVDEAVVCGRAVGITTASGLNAMPATTGASATTAATSTVVTSLPDVASGEVTTSVASASASASVSGKPNDWVVIPVFADIVKLALAERENCLQRLPNGHINMNAFDRMAAIVGAFTKHMQAVKSSGEATSTTTVAPSCGEYAHFCWHMQQTTKLAEAELMMASFDCEEPNNAEKLMYDLN